MKPHKKMSLSLTKVSSALMDPKSKFVAMKNKTPSLKKRSNEIKNL